MPDIIPHLGRFCEVTTQNGRRSPANRILASKH
jgi:hypothetical protein